jgi:hypothetical protein
LHCSREAHVGEEGRSFSVVHEERNALFRRWFLAQVQPLDLGDIDWAVNTVIDWLLFVHCGDMRAMTPSWWLLAWAGCPYKPSVVRRLHRSEDGGFVFQWLDKFADEGAPCFLEWLANTVPELDLDAAGAQLVSWLALTVPEVVPWKAWAFGPGRSASFFLLETLLLCRAQELDDRHLPGCMTRIVLDMNLAKVWTLEQTIGTRLPWDLRKVLLEVGDVGVLLFGTYSCCPRHFARGSTDSLADGRQRKWKRQGQLQKLQQGFLHLGFGGGGERSSSLKLALRGACRAQVWVEYSHYNRPGSFVRLKDSHWTYSRDLCQFGRVDTVSDIISVFTIAVADALETQLGDLAMYS